jgi:hypothetical protein
MTRAGSYPWLLLPRQNQKDGSTYWLKHRATLKYYIYPSKQKKCGDNSSPTQKGLNNLYANMTMANS